MPRGVPDGDAVADPQPQIVQRAGPERDLVGGPRRAPVNITGEMLPFSVSIAQVGVVTPLMGTLRTQVACITDPTARSCVMYETSFADTGPSPDATT